jgi:hypothetical protein
MPRSFAALRLGRQPTTHSRIARPGPTDGECPVKLKCGARNARCGCYIVVKSYLMGPSRPAGLGKDYENGELHTD